MLKKTLALLVAALVATALGFAGQLSRAWLPKIGDPLAFHTAEVKAKDLTLVCPGSAFATGGDSGTNISSFKRVGSAVVDYASKLPTGVTLKALPLAGPAAQHQALADTGHKIGAVSTVSSLAVTVADPLSQAPQSSNLLTAQSFQMAAEADLQGALGTACQNPTTEQWFVGGVTTVGREALLILANPTATDATVNLQLYGQQGSIDGAGLNGISVSANRTVVLPLAGFAPQQESLAVHVESAGAAIAGWIQERTVRGTKAAGADLVSPSIPAARSLTIPGLLKRGSADASGLIANNADYGDLTPQVHVYVPGGAAATVTVQVIGADSKTTGTVAQQQVSGRSTAVIPLTGLKDGNYAVFIESSRPVQAAVKLSRTNKANTPVTDFAWLPAVAPNTAPMAVTSPKSAISKISVANPNSTAITAVITNLTTGKSQSLRIAQLGSAVVTAPAGAVVSVSANLPVASTIVADFKWLITAIPLVDYRNVGGSLGILLR
jgi:hypothetical protein